jgi:hypothetical protein
MTAVLRSIESTRVGKNPTNDTIKWNLWDIDRLDPHDGEDTTENRCG